MLNEFIEKILVHERDRKGSIQTTQEVEIYFNFVGRFVPPAFGEVELTPEELEEIRKREERKDRLHQNYLKRKANGKQKEYEAVSYTHLDVYKRQSVYLHSTAIYKDFTHALISCFVPRFNRLPSVIIASGADGCNSFTVLPNPLPPDVAKSTIFLPLKS